MVDYGSECVKIFPSVKAVLSVPSNWPAGWVCISCASFVVDMGRQRTDWFKEILAAAWGSHPLGGSEEGIRISDFLPNLFLCLLCLHRHFRDTSRKGLNFFDWALKCLGQTNKRSPCNLSRLHLQQPPPPCGMVGLMGCEISYPISQ